MTALMLSCGSAKASEPDASFEAVRDAYLAVLEKEADAADPQAGRAGQLFQMMSQRVAALDPATASESELSRVTGQGMMAPFSAPEHAAVRERYVEKVQAMAAHARGTNESRYRMEVERIVRTALDDADEEALAELMNDLDGLQELYGQITAAQRSLMTRVDHVKRLLDRLVALDTLERAGNWTQFGSHLSSLGGEGIFQTVRLDDWDPDAFTERRLERAGIAPLSRGREEYDALLAKLLDPAQKDALADTIEAIAMHAAVYQHFNRHLGHGEAMQTWHGLNLFAGSFLQSVEQIRAGGYPTLSLRQWTGNAGGNRMLTMPESELAAKLRAYRVRRANDTNDTMPMLEDIDGLVGGIASLGDLEAALPELRVADAMARARNEGMHARGLVAQAEQLLAVRDVLENPAAGHLTLGQLGTMGGVMPGHIATMPGHNALMHEMIRDGMGVGVPKAFDSCIAEARGMLFARLFPGRDLEKGLDALLPIAREAIHDEDFETLLLVQETMAIFQAQGLPLANADVLAVRHYLAGLRQLDELGQHRLAAFHFQQAARAEAVVPPAGLLRDRLAALQREHPEDYAAGIADALPYGPEHGLGQVLDLRIPAMDP